MHVQFASISAQDAAATSRLMQEWRNYYCAGGLGAVLTPPSAQTRVTLAVDSHSMRFRPTGFAMGDTMLLVTENGGRYNVAFYDRSLNNGKGSFLSALASLSIQDRTLLGARRSRRDQFLRELITEAKAQVPAGEMTRA